MEYWAVEGNVCAMQDNKIYVVAELGSDLLKKLEKIGTFSSNIVFDDGRRITPDQRKKAYALMGDIADWNGDAPEYIKERMKYGFIEAYGGDYFSLSDCSITTAREFINYLIDFCFYHNVPTQDTMLYRTDDIDHYLYSCILNRKCCICNEKAEIHHVEGSRVGMGFNRNKIDNVGRRAIAICRKHHAQAHNDEKGFFEKYHVYGIKLDNNLVRRLNL